MSLPFARSASVARPTFSRDFAGLKTLDHGAGPSITFTRASNATFFDASGVLQTASNDQPRFDHDPATGASRGLLIEESRTNSIRNSQAGGAVVGAPGTLPNNWFISATPGVSTEVVATGTESGMAYMDIKFSGTNSSGSSVFPNLFFDTSTQVAASLGQTWTTSFYIKIVSGSTSGLTNINIQFVELTAGGSVVATQLIPFTPTSSLTRFSGTRTLTGPTTERVYGRFLATLPNGNSFNLTLRIAAPQLEQGAFPTSYIPTTTAAATRSADSAVVTPISSFYNQSEGTLFGEYSPVSLPLSGDFPRIVQVGNTTNNDNRNALTYWNNGGSLSHNGVYFVATVDQLSKAITTGTVGQTFKAAMAVASNNGHYAVNGSLVGTEDTSLSVGSASDFTHFGIGRAGIGVLSRTAVHIRKIAYYPRRLSNTLLQQLTT